MNSKSILVYRDRGPLPFESLDHAGIAVHWAESVREARDTFDRLSQLHAIAVDVQDNVERALEFCEIVHMTRPAVPIVFVRSAHRPSLSPHCAHRVLPPEASEEMLVDEIFLLLENLPAPPGRQSA